MEENNNLKSSIALRKIPVTLKGGNSEIEDKKGVDEIKIFELNISIDKWEQEILFGDNGFYSIKGKEVEEKSREILDELKSFINRKIYEVSFTNERYREIARNIRDEKLKAVKAQMDLYVQEQFSEWEMTVYEEALSVTIKRGVLYKKVPYIVEKAKQNGIKIIEVIAEKEEWSKKLFNYRKREFLSNFYVEIINAFVEDKDIEAYQYFQQNKEEIKSNECKKLEKLVNEMRINIIAYNWAREVFSYKLEEK